MNPDRARLDDSRGLREESPLEEHRREQREEAAAETAGMAAAYNALLPLGHNAQRRALRWLSEALENIEVPF